MLPYIVARNIPVINTVVLFVEGKITYTLSPFVIGAGAVGGIASLGFIIYAKHQGKSVPEEIGRIAPDVLLRWLDIDHEKTEGGYKKHNKIRKKRRKTKGKKKRKTKRKRKNKTKRKN